MRERISRSTVSEVLAAVESAVGDPLTRFAVYRTLADHHQHIFGNFKHTAITVKIKDYGKTT